MITIRFSSAASMIWSIRIIIESYTDCVCWCMWLNGRVFYLRYNATWSRMSWWPTRLLNTSQHSAWHNIVTGVREKSYKREDRQGYMNDSSRETQLPNSHLAWDLQTRKQPARASRHFLRSTISSISQRQSKELVVSHARLWVRHRRLEVPTDKAQNHMSQTCWGHLLVATHEVHTYYNYLLLWIEGSTLESTRTRKSRNHSSRVD